MSAKTKQLTCLSNSFRDNTPKLTRFFTFSLLPIVCIACFYVSYLYSNYAQQKIEDVILAKGKITAIEKKYLKPRNSNEKARYDILISLDGNNMNYNLSNAIFEGMKYANLIKVGAYCKLLFKREKVENDIVQLVINNKTVLTLADTKGHYINLRNLLFAIGSFFTVWFLSRVYRYQKYGNLGWINMQNKPNR